MTRFSGSSTRSKLTLPVHSTTGLGFFGLLGRSSQKSTRWKQLPGPKAARSETQRLWLSSEFGVNTTNALRNTRSHWRLSTRKQLTGVVRFTTLQLSSAQSSSYRQTHTQQ